MSRCIVLVVGLLTGLSTVTVTAQQIESASGAEIGTIFGLSRVSNARFSTDEEGTTYIGLPSAIGSSLLGVPSIYVTWFVDERFSIGPEFSLGRMSGDGDAFTSLYLAGRTAFHSRGIATSDAYVFGRGAIRVVSAMFFGDSESDTDVGLGAGLGYRWRVGSRLVARVEGGYRRWFDAANNEFSLLLGLGARAGQVAAVPDNRSSRPEIGAFFGLSRFSADGEGATLVGFPSALGSSGTGNPSMYVSWFPSERFSFGPEFSLGRTSGKGDPFTSLYLAGRCTFHSGGGVKSGAYIFGRGAIRSISAGESESDTAVIVGAGLGYSWPAGSVLVVRAEGGYRRWFDDVGTNEISLLLGLGASIGD